MTLSFIRSLFIVIGGLVGYYIGIIVNEPLQGTAMGCISALILILVENRLRRVSVRGLSSMVFGLLLGIFMAKLISDVMSLLPLDVFYQSVSRVILTIIFSYLGAIMALRGKDEFNIIIPYVRFRQQDVKEGVILLDTSVIIDGRISDIYKTNFIAGRLVVPRFVLRELQKLSDSADDIKRQRGRRGLELLRLMQSDSKIDIHIHEDDLYGNDVDTNLVRLAKIMDAKICTTDFNLSRIASLQSVEVLNINDLVHSVKAAVFSGDILGIKLIKEGKESDQALGYLDDGTMVVVSDGRKLIGQNVSVAITSVLQTQAGKMIFARMNR